MKTIPTKQLGAIALLSAFLLPSMAISQLKLPPVDAAKAGKPETLNERVSYSYGVQIGRQLKERGVEIDIKQFAKALDAIAAGKEPLLSEEEIGDAFKQNQKIVDASKENQKSVDTKNMSPENTWESNDGRSIEAEFVDFYLGELVLKRENGVEVVIPESKLSANSIEKARRLAVKDFAPYTFADVKSVWLDSLPPLPPSLHRDYHKVKKANEKAIRDIGNGVYDNLAKMKALENNIEELEDLKRPDLAEGYRKQLDQLVQIARSTPVAEARTLSRSERTPMLREIKDAGFIRSIRDAEKTYTDREILALYEHALLSNQIRALTTAINSL